VGAVRTRRLLVAAPGAGGPRAIDGGWMPAESRQFPALSPESVPAGVTGPAPAPGNPMRPHFARSSIMAKYIALASFTDQGIRNVKETVKRADAVREAARKYGCEMSQIYWTLGAYDLVTIIDAQDEAAATAFAMAIGSAGNVRTQTLRAFSREEMADIVGRM